MNIEQILALAIGAAGQRDNPLEWRKRVLAATQEIAGMANDRSMEWLAAQRVLEADGVFIAIYDGYTFEERSQRCLLQFRDKDTGQLETKKGQPVVIRSDRYDGPLGVVMRERLDAIPIGTRVKVWKALEGFKSNDGDDAKFRVLAYIEPMSERDDERSQGSASPRREPERETVTGSNPPVSPAEPDSPSGSAGDRNFGSIVETRLAEMSGPGRVNFIRHLATEHKIYAYMDPENESKVLRAMEKFNGV